MLTPRSASKITVHEVDYHLDPCERGEWYCFMDDYLQPDFGRPPGFAFAPRVDFILSGWDGENHLYGFLCANQSGMQEFVVIEQQVDGVLTWHRVSTVGFDMDAEMDLKIQLTNLLNVLMGDPLIEEGHQCINNMPGFAQVTKNRVKAVQRMRKDMKDHREGRVVKARVQTRQNLTLRHSR